jgi:hypothetical protein
MATLVYVDKSKALGQRTISAVRLINQGIYELMALNGTRAEVIAVSQAAMANAFGTDSNASAQALSDRISAVVTKFNGATEFAVNLRDLLNATIDGSAP